VPTSLLESWLEAWRARWGHDRALRVELRPHIAGSDLLEIRVIDEDDTSLADVVFTSIVDRRGRTILSVRDQNTDPAVRRRRLMTLVQLFLVHRYRAASIHYLTPTDDNAAQAEGMRALGLFSEVQTEIGQIIVGQVDRRRVAELVAADRTALDALIGHADRAADPASVRAGA
jgi:isocitrate lyase